MSDKIRLPSGAVIANGQLHQTPPVLGERDRTTSARDGKIGRDPRVAKHAYTKPVEVAHGMKRQTTGALHPHLHGQTVDDEVMAKSFGKPTPLHDAVNFSHSQKSTAKPDDHASKHLAAAGHLGRCDDGECDVSFVSHAVSKNAALPASKRKLSE